MTRLGTDHRLLLLRHAKSAWDEQGAADHDRPLAPRGERAAELVAVFLAQRGPAPDLVLCSTALRTRQTLSRVLAHLAAPGRAPEVRYEHDLYLAEAGELLERLRAVPDSVGTVMLVGHNPGLEVLAARLAEQDDTGEMRRLHTGLPTGALVDFSVANAWRDLAPGGARLEAFHRPKDLV